MGAAFRNKIREEIPALDLFDNESQLQEMEEKPKGGGNGSPGKSYFGNQNGEEEK